MAALAAGSLVATGITPATANQENADRVAQPAGRDVADYPTTVRLEHPVSIDAIVEAAAQLPVAPMGYRFEQDGVEGEFYPNGAEDVAQFKDDFLGDYGTEAEIVGVVLAPQAASAEVSRVAVGVEIVDLAAGLAPFDAPPVNEDGEVVERAESEPPANGGPQLRAAGSWVPTYMEVGAMNQMNNQAVISTYNFWEYGTPTAFPSGWGMEINTYMLNSAMGSSLRPLCPSGYQRAFWAGRSTSSNDGIISWSIFNSQAALNKASIGAYWDWVDTFDECDTQSMTIGIGYPRNISLDPNGYYVIQTVIRTNKGSVARNPAGGYYQGITDDCGLMSPASHCMGLNTGAGWPYPGYGDQVSAFLLPQASTGLIGQFPGCYNWAKGSRTQVGAPWLCGDGSGTT